MVTLKAYEPRLDYCGVPDFDSDLPAHLLMAEKGVWLGIMSLAGLKKTSPGWQGALAELEQAVRPGAVPAKPPLSTFDDSRLTFWGRLEH